MEAKRHREHSNEIERDGCDASDFEGEFEFALSREGTLLFFSREPPETVEELEETKEDEDEVEERGEAEGEEGEEEEDEALRAAVADSFARRPVHSEMI